MSKQLVVRRPISGMGLIDDAAEKAAIGAVFGSPTANEILKGRRELTPHGGQDVNPDNYFNENDNDTVLDSRDVRATMGIAGGAGFFGTPAGALISGYAGPTVKREKFPYSSGMGQLKKAEQAWQPTGISLGTDPLAAQKKFAAMVPSLANTDPSMEFKMGPGDMIPIGKIQKRVMGIAWQTVVEMPNPTDDAVRAAADAYRKAHPNSTLRIQKDQKRDYTVLKRLRL